MHRVGRTGRAGARGEAHSFFTSADARHAKALCALLRDGGCAVPDALARHVEASSRLADGLSRGSLGGGGGGGGGGT